MTKEEARNKRSKLIKRDSTFNSKFISSAKDLQSNSQLLQSVNADYLVIRKMSLKRLRKKFGLSQIDDETADKLYKYDHLLKLLDMKTWVDEPTASRFYSKYEEKRKSIGVFVWVYLKLRNNLTNPILMVNDKLHAAQILDDSKNGEVKMRSTIE